MLCSKLQIENSAVDYLQIKYKYEQGNEKYQYQNKYKEFII